jgi:hypothetical protein
MTLDEFTQTLDPTQRMVQSNFGMEERMAQNNRVGGMQRQNDAQPIQGNNPPVFDVFDVSRLMRAGGSGSMGMPANPYRDQPQPAILLPNQGGGMQQPIATDIQQQFRTLDPTTRELFFGSGIPGTSSYSPGFMQQAFRASEKTFYDEQGNPIVVPEQVAGLSPEQQAAINLSREKIGVQDPYLQQSQQAYGSGLESLFGGLGESEQALRDYASAEYDPSSYQQYMDPYQEQVIDQVRRDILEQGAKGDISARASDIARGGESAFGSRARLGAGERTEALGRGLGEALGGLRSQGFQQAQQTAMGEFGRQQQAQQGLAQGLGSLAGARQAGQFGAGQAYAGLGGQAQQSAQADIQRQLGLGQMTQGQQQNQLNAARQNALMQQQAPMQQMQSLLPFVQSVPAGFSQIGTTYGVPPSPFSTGLATGLSALSGIGNFMNPPQYKVS